MKIAILHYHWMLQAHSINLAEDFAKRGNDVYVLGYDILGMLSNEQCQRIHLLLWERSFCLALMYKIFLKIYIKCPILRTGLLPFFFLLVMCDHWILLRKILRTGIHFDLIIGVEKGGGLWAEHTAKKYAAPFLYYSLELYGPGAKVFAWDPLLRVLGILEPRFAPKAALVLVQDVDRAAYLQGYTGIDSKKIQIFPISVRQRWRDKHEVAKNICICFGNLYASQSSLLLAGDHLPDNWQIVLHNSHPQFGVAALSVHPKIVVSDVHLDEYGIDQLLGSAKIGLALYPADEENNKLIVFSSEKISRYLSKGLPFIINADSNADSLFSQFQCGITVNRCEDISCAIESILSNYNFYVEQSFLAYDMFFTFEKNFSNLYRRLKKENII